MTAPVLLAAIVIIGVLGYIQARRALQREAMRHVLAVHHTRLARVDEWLQVLCRNLRTVADSPFLATPLAQLGSSVDSSDAREEIQQTLDWYFASQPELRYIALEDSVGHILGEAGQAVKPVGDFQSISAEVSHVFKWGCRISRFHLEEGDVVMDLRAPLNPTLTGTRAELAVRLDINRTLNPILLDTSGLGLSGESFLVGPDTIMLTPSRFHEHPLPLTHKMPIPAVLMGLEGGGGLLVYKGFLNEKVIGAYSWLPTPRWVLVTEMRTAEAFAPLRTIAANTILAAAAALAVLLVVMVTIARAWTRPIERLAAASLTVAEGRLDVTVDDGGRKDELGILTRQFNRMIESLAKSRQDLEKSHQRLVQSEKLAAIGGLTAAIVHEMRNPLSAIKMNIRILQRQSEANGQKSPHLMLAAGETDRLERMLAELLAYSKPVIIKRTTFNAMEPILEAVREAEPLAERARVRLTALPTRRPIKMVSDQDILTRILVNLISNAIQATAGAGEVIISLDHSGDGEVVYTVSDSGAGMKARVLERIFDPFFTTRDDGIGLGMSNVKKFADALEGRIEITSSEGRGTTVKIFLPINRNG